MRYGREYKKDPLWGILPKKEIPPCVSCKTWIIDRCASTGRECKLFFRYIQGVKLQRRRKSAIEAEIL